MTEALFVLGGFLLGVGASMSVYIAYLKGRQSEASPRR